MADIEAQFKKAVWLIRNGPKKEGSSNDEKLSYYKFYKQATDGDVTGSQPWAVQFEARAKWDAWNEVKGEFFLLTYRFRPLHWCVACQ